MLSWNIKLQDIDVILMVPPIFCGFIIAGKHLVFIQLM